MYKVFLDVECYSNYFLICFKGKEKVMSYELHDTKQLDKSNIAKIMNKYTTVGFNSNYYDLPMITAALKGFNNLELKQLSDEIINSEDNEEYWAKLKKFKISKSPWNHIDIKNVASSLPISLKMYGARMHLKTIQDLPIAPDELIKETDRELLRIYCVNDLDTTIALYNKLEKQLDLRNTISKEYNIDVRSKSDAQIAEAVFRKELNISIKPKFDKDQTYQYYAPSYIKFVSPELNDLLIEIQNISFECNEKGKLKNPEVLKNKKVKIDNAIYKLGIGGLHSTEKHKHTAGDLMNLDVVSYYPNIILTNKLFPQQLEHNFLGLYQYLYDKRLAAKLKGDKVISDCYKIILNGSFGKFGSKYSCLYSPSLLLNTTLTGQLAILMLIEMFSLNQIETISANTDGIIIKADDLEKCIEIKRKWEKLTNLSLEADQYKAVYSESVNSYIALNHNNKLKLKGSYAEKGLNKNPVAEICIEAAIQYITKGIFLNETIKNCKDITKFIVTRAVAGGGIWRNQVLGKVVRWIYGFNGEPITYKINGNKVATSDNAIPLMTLPDIFPDYIDYEIYSNMAVKILRKLGIEEVRKI